MAKKSGATFRDLITDIKGKKYSPIYLLSGEENYYLDKLADFLGDNVIPEEDRDFNMITFYGAETDVETVINAAQRYPMMSDRQLVILKEAQAMNRAKNNLDKFIGYIEHYNPSTILVIVFKGESISSTSKLAKSVVKSGGTVFTSPQLRDYELTVPIKDYCTSKKIGIEEKAVEMLKEYLGNDLSKLFGEIDKMIVSQDASKGLKITAELVEKNIGISKEFNNFELTRALSVKDYEKSMRVIDYFARNPNKNPVVVTTGILFGFFSRLVIAHFSKDKSDFALMTALNIKNTYALGEVKQAMKSFNPSQSVNAISLIRKFDRESKGVGSFQNEYALLKELIFNLFVTK
ncbi:MAG: DNA polymerase III subunit delta [Bacteroidales bacterium]|nr:DNA polymerase III subunit delta [Bacteroidales bacterium]